MKHTPGPWHLSTDGFTTMITDANGDEVYIGANEANARLIAAAPELLEALQDIANHHEHQRDLWSSEECADADQARYHEEQRDVAIAAIAKATDSVWRQDLKD